jgi:hypothetical protein
VSTWVEVFGINEDAAVAWAREHCASFCSWLIYNDASFGTWDATPARYEFEFYDEQDAMLFLMRWGGRE